MAHRNLTFNPALDREIARNMSTLLRLAGVRGALVYLAEIAREDAENVGDPGPASDLRAAARVYVEAAKRLDTRVRRAQRRSELRGRISDGEWARDVSRSRRSVRSSRR